MGKRRLARDVAGAMAVKLVALIAIYVLLFASPPESMPTRLCPRALRQPTVTIMDVVELSRLQFGLTAMYHFLFVPLTLGLSVLLAIMESIYVTTGRTIWRDMVKFWGNAVRHQLRHGRRDRHHHGIPVRHQLGLLRHYVGDMFGAPLAIEGLMAFFLEATFVGLFFFGWERLTRVQHLIVTA